MGRFASLSVLCIGVAIFIRGSLTSKVLQIKGNDFMLGEDGPVVQIRAGEMHYFRVPEVYWEDRLERLRAMGLNAVSTYVPWNWHEQTEGSFDFDSDRKNVVKFLKLAKSKGLYVIVRAGPYICAEWEFGGLPAWLLKYTLTSGTRFRSSDRIYLALVDKFWEQLLPRVREELQENGGAVVMVQVENEFGAFAQGSDSEPDYPYLEHLRKAARKHLGDQVLLISTNNAKGNVTVPGLFNAVNLGPWSKNPSEHLDRVLTPVREMNGGTGPDFVMELWAGWFQSWHTSVWDEQHVRAPTSKLLSYVKELMDRNASFTLYMAHGGTNFGGWNSGTTLQKGLLEPQEGVVQHLLQTRPSFLQRHQGSVQGNPILDVEPEAVHMSFVTTSYDYAAPISEEGRHGIGSDGMDKFLALKDLISQYQPAHSAVLPEEPNPPTVAVYTGSGPGGSLVLERRASLRDPEALRWLCDGGWQDGSPKAMELHGQQLGMVLYRYKPVNENQVLINNGDLAGALVLKGKDRLTVWHGGDRIMNLYSNLQHGQGGRQFRNATTEPLQPGKTGQLDVLVENLGRRAYFCAAQYGFLSDFFNDWKGLAEAPLLSGKSLEGHWSFCLLPLEDLYQFDGSSPPASDDVIIPDEGPAFFEGSMHVDHDIVADTFLRLDAGPWNTGSAYINGFHLGRYWRDARGPFDLYVPKSVFRKGVNRVVLLEMDPKQDWNTALVSFSDQRGPIPY